MAAMCSVIIYWFHEVLYTTYFYLLNEKKLSGSFRHTMYYSYTLHIVQYSGGLRMSKEPRESLMRPHRPIFFLGHVSSSPLPPCVVSASTTTIHILLSASEAISAAAFDGGKISVEVVVVV